MYIPNIHTSVSIIYLYQSFTLIFILVYLMKELMIIHHSKFIFPLMRIGHIIKHCTLLMQPPLLC